MEQGGPGGAMVLGAGRLPAEGLMGPLLIVLGPEAIEGPLLGDGAVAGGDGSPPLEGPVHPLMGPTLLRPARIDALVLDARRGARGGVAKAEPGSTPRGSSAPT